MVLPAPLRPTRPTLSPAATRKLTPSIRSRAPARTSSWWAVIILVTTVSSVRFNPKATIDTSRTRDAGRGRGGGGGLQGLPIPGGGGGIAGVVILIVIFLVTQFAGGRPRRPRWRRRRRFDERHRPLQAVRERCGREQERRLRASARRELPRVLLGRQPQEADRHVVQPRQGDRHLHPGRVDGWLRHRELRRGPVLLPVGQDHLPRLLVLRGHPRGPARRQGRRLRRAVRARARVRPPHPEPARHHGQGEDPAGSRERRGPARAAGRLLRGDVGARCDLDQGRQGRHDLRRDHRHRPQRGGRLRQDRRRRPHPAGGRRRGQPRGLDARLVEAAGCVVQDRLRRVVDRRLRHVLAQRSSL